MTYKVEILTGENSREIHILDIERYDSQILNNGRIVYNFYDFDRCIKCTISVGEDTTLIIRNQK